VDVRGYSRYWDSGECLRTFNHKMVLAIYPPWPTGQGWAAASLQLGAGSLLLILVRLMTYEDRNGNQGPVNARLASKF